MEIPATNRKGQTQARTHRASKTSETRTGLLWNLGLPVYQHFCDEASCGTLALEQRENYQDLMEVVKKLTLHIQPGECGLGRPNRIDYKNSTNFQEIQIKTSPRVISLCFALFDP